MHVSLLPSTPFLPASSHAICDDDEPWGHSVSSALEQLYTVGAQTYLPCLDTQLIRDTKTYTYVELNKVFNQGITQRVEPTEASASCSGPSLLDECPSPVISLRDLSIVRPQQQNAIHLDPNQFFNPLEFSPLKRQAPHLSLETIHQIYQYVQAFSNLYWDIARESQNCVLLRRESSHLQRSLIFTPDNRAIVLLNRTNNPAMPERDRLLGEGSYKKITLAIDLSGETYASAGFINTPPLALQNYARFSTVPGFIHCHYIVNYPRSEKELSKLTGPEDHQTKSRLLLEFCDAGDLEKAIQSGSLSPKAKRNIFISLLHYLADLHDNLRSVHRDIKPSNILLKRLPDGEIIPIICDIDAICLDTDEEELENNCGTVDYYSPEFAKEYLSDDDPLPSKARQINDMWAFGCTMFELFEMGELPWASVPDDDDVYEQIAELTEQWFPEPPKETPEHLIWQVLNVNETQRPTAKILLNQVHRVQWKA
ncbi:MAG: protein kinase [Chlamydiae bacterium]|nr:protein kinase [Chlamydiota bacterium]